MNLEIARQNVSMMAAGLQGRRASDCVNALHDVGWVPSVAQYTIRSSQYVGCFLAFLVVGYIRRFVT